MTDIPSGRTSTRYTLVHDPFSNLALKVRVLLDLTRENEVLLAGPHFSSHESSFREAFEHVRSAAQASAWGDLEDTARFDLVCLDVRSEWSGRPPASLIADAAGRLTSVGTIMIVSDNRFSVERLIDVLKRRPVRSTSGATPRLVNRTLSRVGLGSVLQYMALPSHDWVDEYVDSRERDIPLPSYVSALHRCALYFGVYSRVHHDMLTVAAPHGQSGIERLALAVTASLPRAGTELKVVRLSLRERGALILSMIRTDGTDAVVVRGGVTAVVTRRLARNRAGTDHVHSLSSLESRYRDLVPRTLSSFEARGSSFLVEQTMPGVLAWKLPRSGTARARALADALDFIDAFGSATHRCIDLDQATFNVLIGNSIKEIRQAFASESDVASVDRLSDHFLRVLAGKSADVVWGHGDYGFGNLLCDPASGRLTGVIDWDTHVETELAGVDRANLLLQLESEAAGGDLSRAFRSLIRRLPARDNTIMALAAVRMVHRSTAYATEFRRLDRSYAKLLSTAGDLLSDMKYLRR